MTVELFKRCIAESVGTGFLVFFGTAAAVGATFLGLSGLADWLAIALAFALAAMMAIYGIGHISGAHINPAVSIAMYITGRMKFGECIGYIIAQLIGATIASTLVFLAFGQSAVTIASLGATTPATTLGAAFIVEIIATFALLTTVMAVIDKRNSLGNFGGMAIALTIGGAILSIGTISGGSLNPARTFGPYIIDLLAGGTNYFAFYPIYIFGPIIGALAAVFLYDWLNADNK